MPPDDIRRRVLRAVLEAGLLLGAWPAAAGPPASNRPSAVRLPDSPAAALAVVSTPAVPTSLAYFGLHIGKTGVGTDWPPVRFGAWRLWDAGVSWAALEPRRAQWHFERLDADVELAQAKGVTLSLPLGLSPAWASARPGEASAYGPGQAAEPADLSDWTRYVSTVAARYHGRIMAYEIWNEPNDRAFFSGTIADLVRLTCAARTAIRAVDPEAKVVSSGITGIQNIRLLEDFLRQGGAACIDVVAYHFYVMPRPPEAIAQITAAVQGVMRAQGIGALPLWNTESGWAMANEDGTPESGKPDDWELLRGRKAAAYVARALIVGRAVGLERFFWYGWDGAAMGLVEPLAGTPKTGALAYDTVARWLAGRPAPQCRVDAGIWACRLAGGADDGDCAIYWHDAPGEIRVPMIAGQTAWTSAERADASGVGADPTTTLRVEEVPVRACRQAA